MSGPWPHPKTGIYYYRKGVPEPLRLAVARVLAADAGEHQSDLKPKHEVRRSLGTAKLSEATVKWSAQDVWFRDLLRRANAPRVTARPMDHKAIVRNPSGTASGEMRFSPL
ncbi:MAG: hypothetical protein JWO51_1733 [Rhodospirillales bacterium]|nr:hypothetical protein [Rhodospirillales bacterium]